MCVMCWTGFSGRGLVGRTTFPVVLEDTNFGLRRSGKPISQSSADWMEDGACKCYVVVIRFPPVY